MSEIQGEGIKDPLNCRWQAAHVISVILTDGARVRLRHDLETFGAFYGAVDGDGGGGHVWLLSTCILNVRSGVRSQSRGRRHVVGQDRKQSG